MMLDLDQEVKREKVEKLLEAIEKTGVNNKITGVQNVKPR